MIEPLTIGPLFHDLCRKLLGLQIPGAQRGPHERQLVVQVADEEYGVLADGVDERAVAVRSCVCALVGPPDVARDQRTPASALPLVGVREPAVAIEARVLQSE